MMKLDQLKELDNKYILNTYKRYPLQIVSGKGVYVYDENNNSYLDFLSGIAVNALGHCHPKVVSALEDQLKVLIHASNLFYTESSVLLASKLCKISNMDKVFFCNSGAEANELAIKISRVYANNFDKPKNTLVCLENSFHGRTLASLSVTKAKDYAKKFAPLVEKPKFIPLNDLEALKEVVKDDTSCIILEPIQGEGGINLVTKEFLQLARNLSDKYNALLVFDEVQSGFGRTGDYFAYQFSGVEPDVITLAKPIAAGLPMGAVLIKDKFASLLSYGDHGSTFGANCLATSAALAFLDVMDSENLLEHVKNIGKYLYDSLNDIKLKYDFIKEIRGRGLMIGMEFDKSVADIHIELLKSGLITNCTSDRVIRLLPPYIITEKHVDKAVFIIDKVLSRA